MMTKSFLNLQPHAVKKATQKSDKSKPRNLQGTEIKKNRKMKEEKVRSRGKSF